MKKSGNGSKLRLPLCLVKNNQTSDVSVAMAEYECIDKMSRMARGIMLNIYRARIQRTAAADNTLRARIGYHCSR